MKQLTATRFFFGLLLWITSVGVASAAIMANGLGGDAGFGEGVESVNDDGSSAAIDITPVFGSQGLNFFGTYYTQIYVNTNGNITFSSGLSQYTPEQITQNTETPMIAPFFADVDTRGGAGTATPGGTSTGSNRVYWDLDTENQIVTVTWDDVGYYSSHNDKLNAFQLRLFNRGNGDFDIQFIFEATNWTTGDASGGTDGFGGTVARSGWTSGNGTDYYELPQSGNESAMLSLQDSAPVGFQVRSGVVSSSELYIVPQTLESAPVETAYNATLSASGGTPPYTWAITEKHASDNVKAMYPGTWQNILDGLTIDAETGELTWDSLPRLPEDDTYNIVFTVQVTDSAAVQNGEVASAGTSTTTDNAVATAVFRYTDPVKGIEGSSTGGGCSLVRGDSGGIDPLLPLLSILAALYLWRRRRFV